MLMNIAAAGCFLIVAGVMAAMWKFDKRSGEKRPQQETEAAKNRKGR